ncbi:MAG: sigma factor, partial [bacterium]
MQPARHRAPDEIEDRQQLASIARRDSRAFESLYDRYSRSVYSLALGMLRDPATAQEVTQEVFVIIWRLAAEFDPRRGTARSWVLALA